MKLSHTSCCYPGSQVLLITSAQVHYASVDHIPQEGDDSGVFLQYTEQVGGPMFERQNLLKEQS